MSERNNSFPPDGDYYARRNKPIVIVESKDGALGAEISYDIVHPEIVFKGVETFWFGAKDGTVMQFTWDALKEIFPDWGAENPFELEDIDLNEDPKAAEFVLAKCYVDDTWTPPGKDEPVEQWKVRFLNSLTRGRKVSEPLPKDKRKAVLSKWTSRFKAINSAKPAATQAPAEKKAASAPPARAASGGPPSRKNTGAQARTCTQEEVWGALVKSRDGKTEDEVANEYYAALDEHFEGRSDLTIQEWGQLADKLGV